MTPEDWVTRFQLPFDVAIDPTRSLGPYYDINAFPMNMIVRTRDMQIVWQKNGVATAEMRAVINSVLAE